MQLRTSGGYVADVGDEFIDGELYIGSGRFPYSEIVRLRDHLTRVLNDACDAAAAKRVAAAVRAVANGMWADDTAITDHELVGVLGRLAMELEKGPKQ